MTFGNQIKDNLNILGLENATSIDENTLKRAYLKASKKYHPDVCEEQYKDGIMFKKVNEANTFIKDNMSTVNDYLSNPSKYQYQQAYSSNTTSNAQYQYQGNFQDFFSNFFRAYQQAGQRQYTEEEIKEIKKAQKRRVWKRRIFAACGLALSIALVIFAPGLAITIAFFALLLFL